jgi:hypothetical protein
VGERVGPKIGPPKGEGEEAGCCWFRIGGKLEVGELRVGPNIGPDELTEEASPASVCAKDLLPPVVDVSVGPNTGPVESAASCCIVEEGEGEGEVMGKPKKGDAPVLGEVETTEEGPAVDPSVGPNIGPLDWPLVAPVEGIVETFEAEEPKMLCCNCC